MDRSILDCSVCRVDAVLLDICVLNSDRNLISNNR